MLNNFVNDFRVLKTCRSLAAAGYDVAVVALHDGSAALPEREVFHTIPVHRIRLKTKKWSRLHAVQQLKYLEFVFRACRGYRGADIYHCNDLSALPIGVLCRLLSGGKARIVYDAHEHESERSGFSWLMRHATRLLERMLIRFANRVITVSPSIADDYVRLYGIPRPELVYNAPYYIEKQPKDTLRSKLGIAASRHVFLYQGGLSPGRGIEILLATFAEMDPRFCLVVVGGGVLAKSVQEHAARCSNIFHVPFVDPMSLWELTFSADYGVHLIENTCRNHYLCLPNKLFEYMMAELPVVVSNMLELERFVTTHQVGVVSQVCKEALRERLHEIVAADYARYVENIRQVKRAYTWEQQERKLLDLYEDVRRNHAASSVR